MGKALWGQTPESLALFAFEGRTSLGFDSDGTLVAAREVTASVSS